MELISFLLTILVLTILVSGFTPKNEFSWNSIAIRDKIDSKSGIMNRLFAIALSALLILGFAPIAHAAKGATLNRDRPNTSYVAGGGSGVSGLTPCTESTRFQERASLATTPKDINRFKRYGQALCGDDGLPHLIVDGRWDHAGELFIPMFAFIYITGTIGWAGRSYLIESRKKKNSWENETHIDFKLARRCVLQAAAWPALADKEWRSGNLLKDDKDVSLNGPR